MKFPVAGGAAVLTSLVLISAILFGFVAPLASVGQAQTSTNVSSGESTEINWQGAGIAIPPRNTSSLRYNAADSAVLQLPDGTFRMYYGNFSEPSGQYNCAPGCSVWTSINSAVSKDGTHWTVEPGARIKTQQYSPPAINSVISFANGTIHLYVGSGNVYSSNDGLNFALLSKTLQVAGATCPGCGLYGPGSFTVVPLANGQYRMYMDQTFNGTDPRYQVVKVYSYISPDGFSFTQESGVRLGSPLQYGTEVIRSGGHPLVYRLANGTWIMYFDSKIVSFPPPPLPGEPSVNPNPVCVTISKDGLNWNITRTTFVQQGEAYQITTASSGTTGMVFGYYGLPQFPLASYANFYGGGLYYALPFYHIISGGSWYNVGVSTTSTISSWTFSSQAKQTVFKVASLTPSFLNLTIPSVVLSGSISVALDGTPVSGSATISSAGTANRVYVAFPSGNHTVAITGTSSLPTSTTTTSTTTASTPPSTTSTSLTSTSIPSTTAGTSSTTYTSPIQTSSTIFTTSPTATQTTTTGSSTTSGGGIPEFPYQLAAATVLTFLVVASYLLVRRRASTQSYQRTAPRI